MTAAFLSRCFLCLAGLAVPASAQNWIRVADLPAEYVNATVEASDTLYAVTDSAVHRSVDLGASWTMTPGQPGSNRLSVLAVANGAVYLGSRGDGVFRTNDGGTTWQSLSAGLSGSAGVIVGFAVRGDSLFAATGGAGVYVHNLANPAGWTAYNAGLFQYGCSAIVESGGTLVAGIGVYLFTRSRDAAQWSYVIFDSAFSTIPLTLLRHGSSLFLGTTHGVYRGDSDGGGWIKADIQQFPNRNIVALAADGPRLFAGLNYLADHWIFTTTDAGAAWEIHSHEFAGLLSLTNALGALWAGRVDGLWRFDLGGGTGVGNAGTPRSREILRNYPNPFNPGTSIEFDLPASGRVVLEVFEPGGRRVALLLDERRPAGPGRVTWSADGRPSGVYFCRLTAGGVVATRKLLLVR